MAGGAKLRAEGIDLRLETRILLFHLLATFFEIGEIARFAGTIVALLEEGAGGGDGQVLSAAARHGWWCVGRTGVCGERRSAGAQGWRMMEVPGEAGWEEGRAWRRII